MSEQPLDQDYEKLKEHLAAMDVPEYRMADLRWLNRNLFFNNYKHENYPEALKLIHKLLRANYTPRKN